MGAAVPFRESGGKEAAKKMNTAPVWPRLGGPRLQRVSDIAESPETLYPQRRVGIIQGIVEKVPRVDDE
jgi:hypothetical protein